MNTEIPVPLKTRTKTIKVADVVQASFVRKALSDRHIEYFFKRLKCQEEVGSIIVNQSNQIIDGRHRLAAYKRFGDASRREIVVQENTYQSPLDEYYASVLFNDSRGLAMTYEDLLTQIEKGLLLYEDRQAMCIKLSPLYGVNLFSKAWGAVQNKTKARLMSETLTVGVRHKLSWDEAAKRTGADLKQFEKWLARANKKKLTEMREIASVKAQKYPLRDQLRSVSGKLSRVVPKLVDKVACQQISEEEALSVVAHLENWRDNTFSVKLDEFKSRIRDAASRKHGAQGTRTPVQVRSSIQKTISLQVGV